MKLLGYDGVHASGHLLAMRHLFHKRKTAGRTDSPKCNKTYHNAAQRRLDA